MGSVHSIDHPLIQHKVAMLRDVNTQTKDFRNWYRKCDADVTSYS